MKISEHSEMGLNDSDHKSNVDNFYSPMCVSGYLTPLQRKKLREKRNTPLSANFEADFKTPKSSKDVKKSKRPTSTKPKPKVKAPKEQHRPKFSKENMPELRCSVANLVAHDTNNNKEKRFFKNRSPLHLSKTEFVLPLTCKKRCLDFSSDRNNSVTPLRTIQVPEQTTCATIVSTTEVKSKVVDEIGDQTSQNKVFGKCQPINEVPAGQNKALGKCQPINEVPTGQNKALGKCQPINEVPTGQNKALGKCQPINEVPTGQNKALGKCQPINEVPTSQNKALGKCQPINEVPADQKKALGKCQPINEVPEGELNSCLLETPKKQGLACDELVDTFSASKSEICINGNTFDFNWPSDEELLKRQNKARSEAKKSFLAYRELLNKSSSSDDSLNVSLEDDQQNTLPKLYPIFCKTKKQEYKGKGLSPKKISCIRDTSRGDEQMIIDAGQKEIGSRLCKTCNMLYTIGHEEDERLHEGYHHTFLLNLRFTGWKNECIVGEFDDGRIIMVKDTDKNFTLKKVQDVLAIANRDLGFSTSGFPSKPNILFYLFVSNENRVGGCLVAEPIESACPVVLDKESKAIETAGETSIWKLGNWYASTQPVPAICGINRIWVAMEFRRQKVASRLVDCLRGSFIYGHVVDFREMAFTDPSPDGREFAASYTGTDNFLVYK